MLYFTLAQPNDHCCHIALPLFRIDFCTSIQKGNQQGKSFDYLGPYGLPGEHGESIVAEQVAMATDRSGRRTMPTGGMVL